MTTVDMTTAASVGYWHQIMRDALNVALNSPDQSTQNGAVLLNAAGTRIGADCNRFPDGVSYDDSRWVRPLKYSFVEHAERNAIYQAAKFGNRALGGTLVAPWAACADCARSIIQAGIGKLVRCTADPNARWDESIAIGDTMMVEAGIIIVEIEPPEINFTLRRNGEEWPP